MCDLDPLPDDAKAAIDEALGGFVRRDCKALGRMIDLPLDYFARPVTEWGRTCADAIDGLAEHVQRCEAHWVRSDDHSMGVGVWCEAPGHDEFLCRTDPERDAVDEDGLGIVLRHGPTGWRLVSLHGR